MSAYAKDCLTESVFAVDDIKMNVKIKGSGVPLLLLHGNGESSDIFVPQIEYFSKKYMVIAPDIRAHGKSDRGNKPLDFYTFAADIEGLLQQMQIDSCSVIGFSDGANTAIHLALTSKLLKQMVLVGGNIYPKGLKYFELMDIRARSLFLGLRSFLNKKYVAEKEVWDLMLTQPQLAMQDLESILIPTMVMAGENDMIKTQHTKDMAKHIRNSELRIIPKANHFLLFKRPDEVNPIIDQFVSVDL